MFVLHGRPLVAGIVLAILAATQSSLPATLRADATQASRAINPAGASLRYFSADVIVRQRRVTPAGAPVGLPRPDVAMRVVREQQAGRWVTRLSTVNPPGTLLDVPGGPTRQSNPFAVSHVELRDDEEDVRMFDRQGRRMRPMTPDDMKLVGAAALVSGTRGPLAATRGAGAFLAEAGKGEERRRDLVGRFGAPTGRTRGLERYVKDDALGRLEVLVTPDTALPVEVLASSAAAGEMRTAIAYEARGPYGHLRRLMRSEHHFAQVGTGRAVTEVELTNVVLSTEVQR